MLCPNRRGDTKGRGSVWSDYLPLASWLPTQGGQELPRQLNEPRHRGTVPLPFASGLVGRVLVCPGAMECAPRLECPGMATGCLSRLVGGLLGIGWSSSRLVRKLILAPLADGLVRRAQARLWTLSTGARRGEASAANWRPGAAARARSP